VFVALVECRACVALSRRTFVVEDLESAVVAGDCCMAPLNSDGDLEGLAHELSLGETQPPLSGLA
jgi:hypothetical protein